MDNMPYFWLRLSILVSHKISLIPPYLNKCHLTWVNTTFTGKSPAEAPCRPGQHTRALLGDARLTRGSAILHAGDHGEEKPPAFWLRAYLLEFREMFLHERPDGRNPSYIHYLLSHNFSFGKSLSELKFLFKETKESIQGRLFRSPSDCIRALDPPLHSLTCLRVGAGFYQALLPPGTRCSHRGTPADALSLLLSRCCTACKNPDEPAQRTRCCWTGRMGCRGEVLERSNT